MAQLVRHVVAATIANGQSLSAELELGEGRLAAIQMPADWTTAGITFQVAAAGGSFANLYDAEGTEYAVTVGASRMVLLPIADFLGFARVKIRSGTAGSPVNQAAARELQLVVVG